MAVNMEYREGQIIVGFKCFTSDECIEQIIKNRNLTILRLATRHCLIEVPIGKEADLVKELQQLPEVDYAELDYTF